MATSAWFLEDFYKFGHVTQYDKNITQIWSNWTPRYTLRQSKPEGVVFVGLQRFMVEWLQENFRDTFFNKPLASILAQYRELFGQNAPTGHIEQLHAYGRLPVKIYAVPEGTTVPYGVAAAVVTNTQPWAYWVPNYLETLMSCELWPTSTAATTAREFRRLFERKSEAWAAKQGYDTDDYAHVCHQGHDFSMRGMMGVHAAELTGLGHLTQFDGTDTVPAFFAREKYYGRPLPVDAYVPATEHSVMSAGGPGAGEFATLDRLLFETYPDAPIISLVADTWDLWRLCTEYFPSRRERILARPGIVVVRPDSGDPVKIICGENPECLVSPVNTPAMIGVARLLAQTFGTTNGLINKVRMIYGDGINLDRAERILNGLIDHGLSPANIVLGLGSFTYQFVTRDTDGWAMKATAVRRAIEGVIAIWKDPVTDTGGKKSARGIPFVYKTQEGPLAQAATIMPEMLDSEACAMRCVFDEELKLFTEWSDVIELARQ